LFLHCWELISSSLPFIFLNLLTFGSSTFYFGTNFGTQFTIFFISQTLERGKKKEKKKERENRKPLALAQLW
jgi:hypothetical protein